MSTLGKNLIKVPDVSEQAKEGCGKAGGAVSDAADKVGDGLGKVGGLFGAGDKVNDAIDNAGGKAGDGVEGACNKGAEVADKAVQLTADLIDKAMGSIAKAIGIREYYSVHMGVLCEGEYKPLFSDKDAKPEVDKCSKKFYTGQTDLSKKLDEELNVGPFKFKLSDLELVDEIQEGFDKIPKVIASMAYFVLFSVLVLVVGFLCCVAVVGLEYAAQGMRKFAIFGAMGCLGLGWFTSFICAAVITGVAESIKKAVNKNGDKFGLSASTSPALYFLLWGTVFFATAALGLMVVLWLKTRHEDSGMGGGQQQQQQYVDKNQSASSMEDSHGFAQMPVGGGGGGAARGDDMRDEPL
ncbi:hypothetical protein F5144DRAFT_488570 [Chaetomium tenue]|uniref:Uncharacterized protein n=1 Tax=Chaetomium tenue TaxID=1854479 RepID=A0ACB7PB15_9PEZI|nr:hypothetical protein F5144DRAFT_488570 [Chaetomium globosum]